MAADGRSTDVGSANRIRFDAALLTRVDRAAKRCGVSRSAWVAFTLSKSLDNEEQA
jgi:hypothetical protein